MSRPNYAGLRAFYHQVEADGLLQGPIERKHTRAWADVKIDFEDALFELLPRDGLGNVILDPADIRTEHVRVTNAVITLHDWLRLYQEIIEQPPPQGLKEIEWVLCQRRNELNCLYPPSSCMNSRQLPGHEFT